ncbi:uncharacterized protein EAF01_010343 [Botrytis porri]|uniref:uncharacterized protein n=1 Tax=Botrytis porri TaxID=87229 RepID=UPI0019029D9F|nr:uncharacterized protein EAF01_010343 [Botrytis porri]KAF7892263.1 hypothetical protein EAF01_010343 [Botrytis porri]
MSLGSPDEGVEQRTKEKQNAISNKIKGIKGATSPIHIACPQVYLSLNQILIRKSVYLITVSITIQNFEDASDDVNIVMS